MILAVRRMATCARCGAQFGFPAISRCPGCGSDRYSLGPPLPPPPAMDKTKNGEASR